MDRFRCVPAWGDSEVGQWSRQAGGGTRGGEIRPEAGRGGEPDGMASISDEHWPSNTDHGGVRGTLGKQIGRAHV